MITRHRPGIQNKSQYLDYMYSQNRLDKKIQSLKGLTIPSIKAQTYKNIKWYIFYSDHLPQRYRNQLKECILDVPNTELIEVDNFTHVNNVVKKLLKDQHKYITVKVDDDDGFHPSYFALLAKHYQPNIILTPPTGYMVSAYDFGTQKGSASVFTYSGKECAASGLAYADHNVLALGNHTQVHKTHRDSVRYLQQKNLFVRLIEHSNLSEPHHKGNVFPFDFKKYIHTPSHKANTTRKMRYGPIMRGGATRKHFPELGEGRSKSIYIEPTVNDTAVLLAFYNPARFRRILRNILYIIEILKEKNIPYYVVECVFNDAKPQIPDSDLVVRSNSYMFYKEQLLNKLEKIVPKQYTKLVMLDGDIMFDSPNWIDQISRALDTSDMIQPYLKACWLMAGNKQIKSWKYSYAYAMVKNVTITPKLLHMYHPGFAWAFRRTTFNALGGFYPNAIIGNGDMLFTFNMFEDTIPEYWIEETLKTRVTIEDWPKYHANFKRVAPTISYINIRALHLFHGLSVNRQYRTRYKRFANILNKSWNDHIVMNKDGLTEFRDPELRNVLLDYFKDRNEDIPLEQAIIEDAKRTVRPVQTETVQEVVPESELQINENAPAFQSAP